MNQTVLKLKEILTLKKATSDQERLFQFKELYQQNNQNVRKLIFWMVKEELLDDLVQETFLKGWKNFSKFRSDSTFRTWISKIAINTVYDHYRKSRDSEIFNEEEIADQNSIENDILDKDLIRKGVLRLSEKQREIFVMYYKLGFTVEEISKVMNISSGTVKSRLHHSRIRFEEFLKKNGVQL